MKKAIKVAFLICLMVKAKANAQAPSGEFLKRINSLVPGSPEAGQIKKYVDYPVNLYTGTPQISIPIYTVTGNGISLPISLSYHAGGGVKIDEQASNVGLGWLLNAGGEITREVRSTPDDFGTGFIYNQHPISYYQDLLATQPIMNNYLVWTQAETGVIDLEPDIFYFSFGGYSGKYIYDESVHQFVCVTDRSNIKIAFDNTTSASFWTITTEDGSKYVFANIENSSTQANDVTSNQTVNNRSVMISSWKLSKIINADATDSILLNYDYNDYHYYTAGSNIIYQEIYGNGSGSRPPVNSYSYNNVTGFSKLTGITSKNFTVTFVDDTNNRLDCVQPQKAISKIIIKNANNDVLDIFKLSCGYYNRQSIVGTNPYGSVTTSPLKKSLRLDSIAECGNSETNLYPLTHRFTYNSTDLPCRLSFAKDFFGYTNGNIFGDFLAPPMTMNLGNGVSQTYTGANRYADDVSKTKAGILEKITLPTGGTVQYDYESNTVGYPIKQASTQTIGVNINLSRFKDSMAQFNPTYDTTFTVNQDPNPLINNMEGGVIAHISVFPTQSNGIQGQTPYSYDKPHFIFERTDSAGISYVLQYGALDHIALPNGSYKMTAYTNGLNTIDVINSIRAFSFNVYFETLDNTVQYNYNACGLRIKNVTTTDPYGNVSMVKRYRYHDPVTDSSYGKFIGTSVSNYYELSFVMNGGMYLVRMGSNNMPGQGEASSAIAYPKVIEETTINNIVNRTEHNYSVGVGIYPYYSSSWPFLPCMDVECGRGNEELTEWKAYNGTTFVNAKRQRQVFDFDPSTFANPNVKFAKRIYGIKCQNDSYSGQQLSGQSFPPAIIAEYYTSINRLYLTSDSTITYDITNSNNGITEWHDYTYGDKNMQPMIVRSGNSDGSVSIQKNYYPSDMPDANSYINPTTMPLSQMVTANRITQPLGTTQFKDGQLLSQQYTYSHFSGNQLLVDSMRQALFNNPLDAEIKVQSYSPFANPLSILLRGNKYRKYIWNDALGLPLATCVAGQDSKFVFTSFEYNNEIPWINTSRTTTNAFSGKYAYNLLGATISITGLSSSTGMDVYVWSTGGGITANGTTLTSTGKTKGSWTLYTTHVGNVSTISIAGSALIDQLLVLPTGSQFQGNVYDGMNRVSSVVNDQIATSFYEYDNFGRLTTVKDEQGNILKSTSYQYQGPQ